MLFSRICRPKRTPEPGTTSASKKYITAAGSLPPREAALLTEAGLCERGLNILLAPQGREPRGFERFKDTPHGVPSSPTEENEDSVLVYYRAELVRSSRKTIALQIKADGKIFVRAPWRVPERELQSFLESRTGWLGEHLLKTAERLAEKEAAPPEDAAALREKRREFAPLLEQKVAYYAARMGVTYGRITIRSQRTRWGSCSSAGNLNFNIRLADLPEELLDYVVVHELAHRREMNHSADFWNIVEREMPDWRERRKKLREYRI